MTQKEEYQSYLQEAEEKRKRHEKELEKAEHELEQAEHKLQREVNRATYIKGRRNKIRNSRLIHKGLAIESVCKDTELMDDTEFYLLAEELFDHEDIRKKVSDITAGRRENYEKEQQKLHELQMELQEMKKGGDGNGMLSPSC